MIKKFLILFIIAFFTFTQTVFASGYSDVWSYAFHMEYRNGTLAPDTSSGESYTPIPELSTPEGDPSATDFYGVIIGVKGKELNRFGFNTPKTTVAALGKSIFDVKATFFADADHVSFYTQQGKHLFDISVKGSSFCNDNNVCNADVGEDYTNCPNDCPAPIQTGAPIETAPITEPVISSSSTTEEAQPSQVTPTGEGVVLTNAPTPTQTPVSKTKITLIILGFVFVVLLFILWKLRKYTEE